MIALLLRATGEDLNNEYPQRPASSLEKGDFIPDKKLNVDLIQDMIPLIARVIVDNVHAFKEFRGLVVRHIPHKYSKRMSEKSQEASMTILL